MQCFPSTSWSVTEYIQYMLFGFTQVLQVPPYLFMVAFPGGI